MNLNQLQKLNVEIKLCHSRIEALREQRTLVHRHLLEILSMSHRKRAPPTTGKNLDIARMAYMMVDESLGKEQYKISSLQAQYFALLGDPQKQ